MNSDKRGKNEHLLVPKFLISTRGFVLAACFRCTRGGVDMFRGITRGKVSGGTWCAVVSVGLLNPFVGVHFA